MEIKDSESRTIVEEWLDVDSSVPTKVQRRLAALVEENQQGINMTKLAKIYKQKYNLDLNVLSYEATSVLQLVGKLKKLFRQVHLNGTDIVLFPAFLPEGENELKLKRQLDTTPADVRNNMKKILVKAKISNPTVGGIYYDEFLKTYEETYGTPLTFEKFNSVTFDEYINKQKVTWMKEGSYDGKSVLKYEIEEQCPGEKEYGLFANQKVERSKFPPDVISPHEKLEFLDFKKEFKVGDTLDVFIPIVKSCDRFYIQLKKYADDLDDVGKEMDLFYESDSPVRLPSWVAVSGMYCATYYKNKHNWFRVQIVEVSLTGACKCYYVDYGTEYNLNPKNLYYLNKKFGALPMQGICASLAFAAPPFTYWSERCTKLFRSLTQGNGITAKVVSVDPASFNLEVELFAKGQNVLDILVQDRMAIRVEPDEEEEFFQISDENVEEIDNTHAEEFIQDEKHSESNEEYSKDFDNENNQDAGQNVGIKQMIGSDQQCILQDSNSVYSSCSKPLDQSLPAVPAVSNNLDSCVKKTSFDERSVEKPSLRRNTFLAPLPPSLTNYFNTSTQQSSSFKNPLMRPKRYGSPISTKSSPTATDSHLPPRSLSSPPVMDHADFSTRRPPLYNLPSPTFAPPHPLSFYRSPPPRQPYGAPHYGHMAMWFPFQYPQPSPDMAFPGMRPPYPYPYPYYQPYPYYPVYPYFPESGWNAKFPPYNYNPYRPEMCMPHQPYATAPTVAPPSFSMNSNKSPSLELNPPLPTKNPYLAEIPPLILSATLGNDINEAIPSNYQTDASNISKVPSFFKNSGGITSSPPSKVRDVPKDVCALNNAVEMASSFPSKVSDISSLPVPSNQNLTICSHEATSSISNHATIGQENQPKMRTEALKPPPGFEDLSINSNQNGPVDVPCEKKIARIAQDIERCPLRRPRNRVIPDPPPYCHESDTSHTLPCSCTDEVEICGKNLVKVTLNDKAYFIVGQIMKNFKLTQDKTSLFQSDTFHGDIHPSKHEFPQLYEKMTLEKMESLDEGIHLIPVHELPRLLYIAGVESIETILEAMKVVMEHCNILDLHHTKIDNRLWDL